MAQIGYDPKEYGSFGTGMVTILEADTIPDDACVYAQNIELSSVGAIGPRKGKQLFGTLTDAIGSISDTHTCKRRDGLEIPLQVRQDGSYGIIEYYYNSQWNFLRNTTKDLTTGFADYVTSTYDRVYFGNGIDDMMKWSMAVTTLTSDVGIADGTIHLADTTDFTSTGKILIGSDEIDYTGKTSTTLTGCTNIGSTHANGSSVTQQVSTIPAMTKGNILLVKDAHLSIAGNPESGPTMVISKTSNPEDFSTSSPRIAGDGSIEDFPDGGGPITSMHIQGEWWVLFKEDTILLFKLQLTESSSGTGGNQEVPVVKTLSRSLDCGAVCHRGTIVSDNEVFYVSKKGGLRSLSSVKSDTGSQDLTVNNLFDVIYPTIQNYDFTSAASIYYDKKILVACKSSSSSVANDVVIVYDLRTKGIVLYTGWNVSSWFVYNKELYFGSSVDQNTYKAFSLFSDYSKTVETPIDVIWRSKRFNFGTFSAQKEVDLIYVEGLISDGTEIEVIVRYDEEGSRGEVTKVISSSGGYVTKPVLNTLGAFPLGTEPLAGILSSETDLNRFRVYLTMPNSFSAYNLDLQFRTKQTGARWKILSYAINPSLNKEPPAHLKL